MASYYQTSPNIIDRRFRDLHDADPNAQALYLYLCICRHRNSEGIFYEPKSYMAADLGLSHDEVDSALEALTIAGFVQYDPDAEVILDRKALTFFQPRGPKQTEGAVRVFKQVPSTWLKAEFLKLAMVFAPDFAEAIVEKCGELVDQALPSEGVSGSVDTVSSTPDEHSENFTECSEDGIAKGYPESQIPRGRAKQLRDGDREEVELEVRSPSQAVAFLKDKLGAEEVGHG
ncbi:MAG: helix-turn-helix domain-containing protein [Actinomycetota bacterium]|nr:helix-turn-helix domain-containing protein [Actinomycetota bacterium]